MEQGEDDQLIGPASLDKGPVVSATVGRVMATLLGAKPKKLQEAISLLQTPPGIAPLTDSLEQSLWFLHKYVSETAERGKHLDEVLRSIIQKDEIASKWNGPEGITTAWVLSLRN